MKTFDFTKLGGMPWYQDSFAFMQEAYQEPIAALAKLGGNGPYILHGVEMTSPGVYNSGVIYYNGEIIPFTGGTATAKVVINTFKTTYVYADSASYQPLSRKAASFGTGAVQFDFALLKTFAQAFGQLARSGWQAVTVAGGFAGQYCEYNYDRLTNVVYVRGAVKHRSIPFGDTPLMIGITTFPASVLPSGAVVVRVRTFADLDIVTGFSASTLSPYSGETIVLDSGGLSISQRPRPVGTPIDFLHYFNFSYSLD